MLATNTEKYSVNDWLNCGAILTFLLAFPLIFSKSIGQAVSQLSRFRWEFTQKRNFELIYHIQRLCTILIYLSQHSLTENKHTSNLSRCNQVRFILLNYILKLCEYMQLESSTKYVTKLNKWRSTSAITFHTPFVR